MKKANVYSYIKEKRPFLLEEWDSSRNGDVGFYTGSISDKVWWKCLKYGHSWSATITNRTRNRNCPFCSKSSTSFVEQFFLLSLREIFGEPLVFSRDKDAIGKELDIYIPHLNFAIEPGDFKYHRLREKEDKKKRVLAKKNDIRLITILWSCKKNYFSKNVWRFKKDISYDINFLTEILKRILVELNFDSILLESLDFKTISERANYFSSRMSNTDFLNHLKSVRDDVVPLENFSSSLTHIEVLCKNCGNKWKILPSNLVRNRQCPVCSRRNVQKKIICLETKEIFFGKREAERVLGHPISYSSLNEIKKVKGKHFMPLSEFEKLSPEDVEYIVNFVSKRPPNSKRKKVVKYTKDGQFLSEYSSILQASLENNISFGNISSVCNGKRKYAGGFVWKFPKK